MSTEMINFLTTKFKTALEEVEKGGGHTGFPLRKIFQEISLVLEMKVTSSIHIQPRDSHSLMACLYVFNDSITECRIFYEARRRRTFPCYTPKEWYQLRKIKVRLLKTLRDLRSVADAGGLSTSDEETTANQQIDPRVFDRSRIYGFDEAMEDIVTSLRGKGESGINTIGIVGMSGSGKTALCQLVYNHPVVKREFIPRIWVSLPDKFESGTDVTKNIAEYILKELGAGEEEEEEDDGNNSASLDVLLVTLHRHLSGRKYLIVYDNVWDVSTWYEKIVNMNEMYTQQGIPLGLPKGYGGCIIITSRLEGDVKEMVGEENLYWPPTLNEEDCRCVFWDELKMNNFDFNKPIPWDFRHSPSAENEVVQNCNGLPSAVKILAHILAYQLPQNSSEDDQTDMDSSTPRLRDDSDYIQYV